MLKGLQMKHVIEKNLIKRSCYDLESREREIKFESV